MDLPGSTYLLALASISITFVSVSTVAFIFRQALGPGLSEVENQLIRGFIRTGLGATMLALLPPLLGLLGIEASLIWRLSSLLFAVVELNALIRYGRTRALYRGLVSALSVYALFGGSAIVTVGALINVLGIGSAPNAGWFALGVTWVLAQVMFIFILTLRIFLEQRQKP